MTDMERLDEAIDAYEQWGLVGFYDFAENNYNGTVALFAAARAYRDLVANGDEWTQQRCNDYADGYEFARRELLANGERVEWCEEHRFQMKPGADVCLASPFTTNRCRSIVSRLLVDPPKEEER